MNLYLRDAEKLLFRFSNIYKYIINNLGHFPIFDITNGAFGGIIRSIKTKSLAKKTLKYISVYIYFIVSILSQSVNATRLGQPLPWLLPLLFQTKMWQVVEFKSFEM